MKIFLVILSTAILFACCSKSKENNLSVSQIKGFADTVLLKGYKTPIYDIDATSSIKICDSLLILHIFFSSPSHYIFRVYNLNTFTKIGDFLQRGRGPDEFNEMTASIQSQQEIKENGDTKIWINNFPNKIVLLNLSKTIATNKTVIDKEYNFARPGKRNIFFESDNSTCTLDDGVFFMKKDIERSKNPDNNHPENIYVIYDYHNDKVIDTLNYQYSLDHGSYLDRKALKIVQTPYYDDLISIYDIPNKRELVLFHTFKTPDQVAGLEKPDITMPGYTYSSCSIKDNLIFALFHKRETLVSEENTHLSYVHLFDLNGKPLYNLVIGESIVGVCLDEQTSILYGIDCDGQLYSYDLKDILHKN